MCNEPNPLFGKKVEFLKTIYHFNCNTCGIELEKTEVTENKPSKPCKDHPTQKATKRESIEHTGYYGYFLTWGIDSTWVGDGEIMLYTAAIIKKENGYIDLFQVHEFMFVED